MPNLLTLTTSDWWALVPVGIAILFGLWVLVLDLVLEGAKREAIPAFAANGMLLVGLGAWISRTHSVSRAMGGAIDLDRLGVAFAMIFATGGYLTLLLSHRFVRRFGIPEGPYVCLIFLATSGMILMAQAADLLVMFVGLEIMSVSFYILVGLARSDPRSPEASLKYFVVGAFASGVILYGIALVFGSCRSLALRDIASVVAPEAGLLAKLGLALIASGFFFKVAAVPFHMWAPDVYEGAPTPVTAFLATGVKAAAFAGLMRVLYLGFPQYEIAWKGLLWSVAALTMVVGNLAAVRQDSLKRMLAYSSIAHAGYLLVGVLSVEKMSCDWSGGQAVVFYLVSYTVATVGAFGLISWTGEGNENLEQISDFRGLAAERPALALLLAVFMVTLAGIPPTSGFAAKYFVFAAAVKQGFVGLAVIGVLTSLVSVFYYLRVVVAMYMESSEPERPFTMVYSLPTAAAVCFCVAGVLYLGILPSACWRMAGAAIGSIF